MRTSEFIDSVQERLPARHMSFEQKLSEHLKDTRFWFDKWVDQYVESGEVSRESLILTEVFNNDKNKEAQVKEFIDLHTSNSLVPTVGQLYAPVGFVLNAPLQRLQIITSTTEIKLVRIASIREYIFDCNGEIQAFPYKHISNYSMGATFFYSTGAEAQQMIVPIILALKEPSWGVEQIIIQRDGTRELK